MRWFNKAKTFNCTHETALCTLYSIHQCRYTRSTRYYTHITYRNKGKCQSFSKFHMTVVAVVIVVVCPICQFADLLLNLFASDVCVCVWTEWTCVWRLMNTTTVRSFFYFVLSFSLNWISCPLFIYWFFPSLIKCDENRV